MPFPHEDASLYPLEDWEDLRARMTSAISFVEAPNVRVSLRLARAPSFAPSVWFALLPQSDETVSLARIEWENDCSPTASPDDIKPLIRSDFRSLSPAILEFASDQLERVRIPITPVFSNMAALDGTIRVIESFPMFQARATIQWHETEPNGWEGITDVFETIWNRLELEFREAL